MSKSPKEDLVDSCQEAYQKLKRAIYNDMVLVTGPPSVGKRTIVSRLFEDNIKTMLHAYVNCYSVTTPTRFFSLLCQEFQSGLNFTKINQRGRVRLPEMGKPVSNLEFLKYFKEFSRFARESKGIKKLYVVLDHVEVFQKTNLMSCFTALVSIKSLNIVIISYVTPTDIVQYASRVSKTAGIRIQDRILPVVVPTWTREDTVNWILKFPPVEEEELYRKFVRTAVTLAHISNNRNPSQTLLFCQDYFVDFLEFYRERTRQQLKEALIKNDEDTTVDDEDIEEYSRHGRHTTSMVGAFLRSFKDTLDKKKRSTRWDSSKGEIKLQTNTTVLIVAAYMAAFTKLADDRKNFVKFQKRKDQRTQAKITQSIDSKPFTFERLYHIYKGLQRMIVGNDYSHIIYDNGFILGDVERLENLNILVHQSGWSLHPDARYKLSPCVKKDYVKRLAANVDLQIDRLQGLAQHNF